MVWSVIKAREAGLLVMAVAGDHSGHFLGCFANNSHHSEQQRVSPCILTGTVFFLRKKIS